MTTASLSFFRCILFLFVFFSSTIAQTTSPSATASDTINISIPDIRALPGQTVTIPIITTFIEMEDSITSFEGSLIYDTNILTLLDLEKEQTLTEIWTLLDPMFNMKGDTVLFAFPGHYPIQGRGALLGLVFQVSDIADNGQTTPIQFNRFILNEGHPYSITHDALFTVGNSPKIDISQREYNFGTVEVGDSTDWQFSISNSDSAHLRIIDIFSDSTQFRIESISLPIVLQFEESQHIRVTFRPTTDGAVVGRLRITSNDPQEPIASIDLSGAGSTGTSIEEGLELNQLPDEYELFQNHPNPFNPRTVIRYHIPQVNYPVHTSLKIFNLMGQQLRTLVDEIQTPGYYAVTWDTHNGYSNTIPSGVYFYTLEAGDFLATKRMVYVR